MGAWASGEPTAWRCVTALQQVWRDSSNGCNDIGPCPGLRRFFGLLVRLGWLLRVAPHVGRLWILTTIYIEIYTVFAHDRSNGRKCAILSVVMQSVDKQGVSVRNGILWFQINRSALRNMPNRATIHGLSSLDTWPFEVRLGRYRNSKHA